MSEYNLELRKVNDNDLILLYWWANDKTVRTNAFNKDLISPEQHKEWFDRKIRDLDVKMYILFVNNMPVGQIRLEKENGQYVIDYSIECNSRGRGFGKILLKLVESKVPAGTVLVGYVKPENHFSRKAFEANLYEIKYTVLKGTIKYEKTVG